jgi:plasmid stabilization system protein ParE
VEVVLSKKFVEKLEECIDYIALDDLVTALNWSDGVFEHIDLLREHPESGRVVSEFDQSDVRELIHGNYRLIYELKPSHIELLTIWHTRRLLGKEFDK